MLVSQSFTCEEVLGLKYGYSLMGKPKMFAHLYYVDGLLIDTGQRKARHTILKDTKKLKVEQIFITHFHEDHSGNVAQLRQKHNCLAYASERCCQIMKNPPKISYAQQMTWGNREPCPDLVPKQGRIETAKFTFDIIPIPGHAPDMVALYEPERQWLFSADLYIHSYIAYFMKEESIQEQIESTRKILELDFKQLFCSHNPQLQNGKQALTKKLHFLESFFENVSSIYKKGYPAKEILKNMNQKENYMLQFLSGGSLSRINMIHSVIRDLERERV